MVFEDLKKEIEKRFINPTGETVLQQDCERIIFLLDNCEITIPEQNRFFVRVNCDGLAQLPYQRRAKKLSPLLQEAGLSDGKEALAHTGSYDFSHTNAEWESVISLGIYGLKTRIAEYAAIHRGSKSEKDFYAPVLKVYEASLRFMERAGELAIQCGKTEMGQGLLRLCVGRPANLFEALQTSIVYYTLQQFFDGTYLRTLGRLDNLFYPYYQTTEREVANQLILDYVKEIDTLDAPSNIPFALCGTDEDETDLTNALSYLLLDTYGKLQTVNTKLHILYSEKTPDDLIEKAFEYIRQGKNSIVLMSDGKVIEALQLQGATHRDAVHYHVVGCYECGAEGELTCSCNARVNIPKALEYALTGGKDMLTGKQIGLACDSAFESYEALQTEFERQLRHLCACAMKATDLFESHYSMLHSAPILSGTYSSALQRGGDLYCDSTAKYNNSSVNGIGLATATDSLAAIRKAVYEDHFLTLSELTEILRTNWSGQEYLRLMIKNKYPKYGQGDKKTDAIAKRIVDVLSDAVSNQPNAKGGTYRLGLFSINWRWDFGKKTAASADGRLAGETLSQNTGASFGADKEGATAHLISAATLDCSKTPNGAIVDLDLHASAVRGANGIKALVTSLKTYFALGGFAVHYNVLDTEVLKKAKQNPGEYPTLQVRLCGWNVLFSTLSEAEKDEFIARSMR